MPSDLNLKYQQLIIAVGLFLKNNFLISLFAISTLLESLVQERYQVCRY